MIDHVVIPEERMRLLQKDKIWEKKLKGLLNIKVELNDEIVLEGDPFQVLRAKLLFKAFGRGFSFKDALNLLDEEYFLHIIEVKEFAKSRNRQIELKGRVIGTKGKIKKMIEKYCDVKIAVYGKTISIIGKWENVQKAARAIEMLLSGAMHKTVYRFLEEQK